MTIRKCRRCSGEGGAALVEFALILPVFMMLILGMFSGGLAYNSKNTITGAAREASRYGATLPVSPGCGATGTLNVDKWLNCVAAVAIAASSGELSPSVASRYVCVSYVNPGGTTGSTTSDHSTKSLIIDGGVTSSSTTDCYTINGMAADGFGSAKRGQVVLKRDRDFNFLFGDFDLTLRSSSATPYEGG